MDKVRFVYTDDWEALYINDDIIMQGHSLDTVWVVEQISVDCKDGFEVYSYSVEYDKMEFFGSHFPKTFTEFEEINENSFV